MDYVLSCMCTYSPDLTVGSRRRTLIMFSLLWHAGQGSLDDGEFKRHVGAAAAAASLCFQLSNVPPVAGCGLLVVAQHTRTAVMPTKKCLRPLWLSRICSIGITCSTKCLRHNHAPITEAVRSMLVSLLIIRATQLVLFLAPPLVPEILIMKLCIYPLLETHSTHKQFFHEPSSLR
eukprot:scpid62362/ scgid12364/ 